MHILNADGLPQSGIHYNYFPAIPNCAEVNEWIRMISTLPGDILVIIVALRRGRARRAGRRLGRRKPIPAA